MIAAQASSVQPTENTAELLVDTSPLAGPLLARVASIMLSRAACPVDRLDDALIICDALAAHAPAHASDGHVSFSLATRPGQLDLRVGSLTADGARTLRQEVSLPGVGDVLAPTADRVEIEPCPDDSDQLVVSLRFEASEESRS